MSITITLKLKNKKAAKLIAEVLEEKSWVSSGDAERAQAIAAVAAQIFDAIGHTAMATAIRGNNRICKVCKTRPSKHGDDHCHAPECFPF